MLTYNTTLPNSPPFEPTQLTSALDGLKIRSPYKQFGSTHQDALNWLGDNNANVYRRAADRANTEYAMRQQEAESQLALAGLQQMNEAQQNQRSLQNSRLQQMTGVVGGLLQGVFR